jgi:hypothetical protein
MSYATRLLIVAILFAVCAPSAEAIPPFFKQFQEKYIEVEGSELPELSKKESCFACHQGKKKKNRNAYGEALSEYLDKKDKKEIEKIVAALETVAAQSSNPDVDGAPTFGELIEAGELPGGPLEDAMKEPEADEEGSDVKKGSGKKGSGKKN